MTHPRFHPYQSKYRDPPDVMARKMKAWRKRARRLLGGQYAGLVLYEGPSQFNGEEIVVVVVGLKKSSTPNPKTGDMLQLYILPRDTFPAEAVRAGTDGSVCGTCPQRPSAGGACYVNTGWAPGRIWSAYHRGNYPRPAEVGLLRLQTREHATALFAGVYIRFGAWGDPVAVPVDVLKPIADTAAGFTGYTHMWRDVGPEWQWLVASVEDRKGLREALRAGWTTFRVLPEGEPAFEHERECPAQAVGLPCVSCRGCSGVKPMSYWIRPHGGKVSK